MKKFERCNSDSGVTVIEWLVIISILVIGLSVVLPYVARLDPKTVERQSIRRVLAEVAATSKSVGANGLTISDILKADMSRQVTEYRAGLERIKLDGCPQDFQDAFLRYYASVGALESNLQKKSGWVAPLERILAGTLPKKSAGELIENVEDAERNLSVVAMQHGVS